MSTSSIVLKSVRQQFTLLHGGNTNNTVSLMQRRLFNPRFLSLQQRSITTIKNTTDRDALSPPFAGRNWQPLTAAQRLKSTAIAFDHATATATGPFPSIIIGRNEKVEPQGSFAEAQAQYLNPDPDAVESLNAKLNKANMGVVAHYYMDVELQGVLEAIKRLQKSNPRIAIADSLAMGDHAVRMCENGASAIACLGVDFMAESVSAILNRNGFGHIPVYRATHRKIGCSLAESAEGDSYRAWLTKAATNDKALHVVYINTSLETKAVSSSIIPTITCTSSNVLRTLLQASAQMGPDLRIFFGPDTYMGNNLVTFFDVITKHPDWTDERIRGELSPHHDRSTLLALKDSINVFPNGNCVVHHMFGADVVDTVKNYYDDAYVTAHLEVPGEMFEIAMAKSLRGKGVVGSTSDILKFISSKVAEASERSSDSTRLKFVLGTEAGMITSIVRSVEDILRNKTSNIEAEIVFPVASDAITPVDDHSQLSVVPGVSGSEGCTSAGGCATCPFMKMNDLDALSDLIDMVNQQENEVKLNGHKSPNRLSGKSLNGRPAIDHAVEPILHMRAFMKESILPEELIERVSSSGES